MCDAADTIFGTAIIMMNSDGAAAGVAADSGGAALESAEAAIQQDAVSALVNLGYGRSEAHAAVVRAQRAGADANLSSLIAAALREMGA